MEERELPVAPIGRQSPLSAHRELPIVPPVDEPEVTVPGVFAGQGSFSGPSF